VFFSYLLSYNFLVIYGFKIALIMLPNFSLAIYHLILEYRKQTFEETFLFFKRFTIDNYDSLVRISFLQAWLDIISTNFLFFKPSEMDFLFRGTLFKTNQIIILVCLVKSLISDSSKCPKTNCINTFYLKFGTISA
jgi:hypothetical protein